MRKQQITQLYPMLELLARLEETDRMKLIPFLNQTGCQGIYECIHNGIRSKLVSLENRKEIKKHLKSDADIYRCLLSNKLCAAKKQKKLTQVGGKGLGLLLHSVLPLLSEHLQT
jgi:hypothetical protein